MRKPADLPDGVYVNVYVSGGSAIVEYTDNRGFGAAIEGHVEIVQRDDCSGHWEVIESEADSGWGPLLYEVAMEHVYPAGLMADRTVVSRAALKVWHKFEQRGDVERVPISGSEWEDPEEDCKPETFAAPVLYYAFRKRPKVIPELKAMGRFMVNAKVRQAAMKRPQDLPPDWFVEITGDLSNVHISLYDEEEFEQGFVAMQRRGPYMQVRSTGAPSGYGPLLYDLALEMVNFLEDRGLMADRDQVSSSAQKVWEFYATKRSDVTRELLPDEFVRRYGPDSFLSYAYRKTSGTPFLHQLERQGQLMSDDYSF